MPAGSGTSRGQRMHGRRCERGWVVLAAAAAGCGGGGGGGGGGSAATLASRYPIDGVVDFTGLATTTATLPFQSGTHSTTLTYAIVNDDRDLYVALEWTDPTFDHGYDFTGPQDIDGVDLLIDDDADGTYE